MRQALVFPAVLFLFMVQVTVAQEVRAAISGQVTDPSGAAVPNALVRAVSLGRNTSSTTATSDSGRYQIGFLLPGTYSISIEASGFKRYVREDVELATGEKLGLDVVMEVGALTESVTVRGQVGLLETESASRGQVITSRELHELPNQGRSVFQMVWAVAGVTRTGNSWGSMSPQGVANATGFSLNGSRPGENEVLLDGVSDVHGGRQVKNVPSLETVEEFKVVTNPYDAQYGRTGGGVLSFTTKSGTNALHGVAWEFVGNRIFNANSFANNRAGNPRPQSNQNIFGFEADGPVVLPKIVDGRNKLFFMFSYEGWRSRGVDLQNFTLPLNAQRSGDFSGLLAANGQQVAIYDPLTTRSDGRGGFVRDAFPGNVIPANRISPVAAKAIAFYPQPVYAGQGPGQVNNYVLPTPNIYGINAIASRMDYHINSANRVHFRYSNTPFEEIRALGWGTNVAEPSGNAPLTRNGVNWSFDWTSTLGPRTVANLRLGLTRWEDFAGNSFGKDYDPRNLGFPDSLAAQMSRFHFPRFEIGGGYSPIGSNRPGNLEKDYAYSLQPSLDLVRSSHVFKIGGEFRRFDKNRAFPGQFHGFYTFSKGFTQANPLQSDALSGNEIASFLLGYPSGGYIDDNMFPAYRSYYYAGFVHDDWKVTSRLTLNLGLRYDYEGSLAERYNRMVRGFAFDQASPIAAQASSLNLKGGLLFAGSEGELRQAFNRDFRRFQPRAGFALAVGDKTVLRGGYGLFFLGQYEEGPGTGFSRQTPLIASNDGNLTPRVTLSNPFPEPLLKPVGSSLGLATDLGLGITAQFLNRKFPYSQQFSFGFERVLPGGWVVESSYSGNLTRRLPVNADVNSIPVDQLGRPSGYYTERVPNPLAGLLPNNPAKNGATIPRQDLLLPFPQYTSLTLTGLSNGTQDYHGWQNRVTKRFAQGYTLQAAYTISKTLEEVTFLNPQDFNLANPLASRLERRLLEWDAPQKLAVLGTYDLPFGRGKRFANSRNSVVNAVIGGWQLNGNLTLQSGFPVPFPNAAPVAARSAKLPSDERSNERWYDTSLWRDPATGRTVPAQAPFTLRTFPTRFPDVRFGSLRNLDLSLFKDFAITERIRLNLRVENYNITNTPWFPRTGTDNVTAANFGSLNLSQTNTPKRFMLGARLLW
jgi:hypothetical protein